jgi:hypothetical protein
MYVYGGSGWQAAGSSVNGTSERATYTATAGQTTFASTYDPGYVDVYLNGVKLIVGTDFTATSGTSVVLSSGAAVGDTVDIVAYGTFVVADTYTKAQADARYVEVAGDTMTGGLNVTGGNVGIGTSSPSANLEITQSGNNVGLLVAGGGYNYTAKFESSDAEANIIIEDSNSTNDGNMIGVATNDMYFITNTSERMRISSAGNVGIGTSSPSALLHLESAGPSIKLVDSDNNPDYEIKNGNGSFRIIDTTAGSDRINISSAGNVGIGHSPTYKVDVAGTNPALRLKSSSGFGYIIDQNTSNGLVSHIVYENVDMRFGTNSAERMRIDSSGNLLVGTTSGSDKVTVNGTVNATAFTGDGSGLTGVGFTTNVVTSSTTATKDNHYYLNGATLTLTLPASPSVGDEVRLSEVAGNTDCVVARNGSNIMGDASDLTIDSAYLVLSLRYVDATIGWAFS